MHTSNIDTAKAREILAKIYDKYAGLRLCNEHRSYFAHDLPYVM